MQEIAAKLAYSETAFPRHLNNQSHQVRFFAPRQEVGLCAHATLAVYHLMLEQASLSPGLFRMETLSGIQTVEIHANGLVVMTQNLPQFGETIPLEDIAPALGLHLSDLNDQIPAQVVSTGLRKIFVGVRSEATLQKLKFDIEKVERISKYYSAIGIYVYFLENSKGISAICRNCAPVVGIMEDSATGTSAAALACHLFTNGLIQPISDGEYVFLQGLSIGQPSELKVQLTLKKNEISEVRVAGKSVTIREINGLI